MYKLKHSYVTGKHCKAEGCLSNRTEKIPFFSFPADEIRSKIWVERCGNKSLNDKCASRLHQYAKLCCKHFESTEFTNDLQNRLHRDALPSIFTHPIKPELEEVNIEANYLLDVHEQDDLPITEDAVLEGCSDQLDIFLKPLPVLPRPNLVAGNSQLTNFSLGKNGCSSILPIRTKSMTSALRTNASIAAKALSVDKTVCRLCLMPSNEATSMEDIFDSNNAMQLKIVSVAEIELYHGDHLPTQICRQCAQQIDGFYQFRKKCQTSDKYLRQHLEDQARETLKLNEEIEMHEVAAPSEKSVDPLDSTGAENIQLTDPLQDSNCESSSDEETAQGTKSDIAKFRKNKLPQTSKNKNEVLGKFLVVDVNVPESPVPKKKPPYPITLRRHCPTCFKSFTKKGNLNKHVRIHSEEGKIYRCTICDKGFTQSQSRTAHMTTHTKERPFKCTICPKGYTRAATLKVHMACHTNKMGKHYCKICDRNFTNLGNHMRKHTGEQPYGCTECDRTFSLAGSLNVHMRMHTNEFPFRCEVPGCTAKYRQRQGLLLHAKKHTDTAEKVDCELCGKSFKCKKDIRGHLFRVHHIKGSDLG